MMRHIRSVAMVVCGIVAVVAQAGDECVVVQRSMEILARAKTFDAAWQVVAHYDDGSPDRRYEYRLMCDAERFRLEEREFSGDSSVAVRGCLSIYDTQRYVLFDLSERVMTVSGGDIRPRLSRPYIPIYSVFYPYLSGRAIGETGVTEVRFHAMDSFPVISDFRDARFVREVESQCMAVKQGARRLEYVTPVRLMPAEQVNGQKKWLFWRFVYGGDPTSAVKLWDMSAYVSGNMRGDTDEATLSSTVWAESRTLEPKDMAGYVCLGYGRQERILPVKEKGYASKQEYSVSRLVFNQPLDDDAFYIDLAMAKSIYDADLGDFVDVFGKPKSK